MPDDIQTPLKEQFPQLFFAKAADEWLNTIQRKNVITQLRERRIIRVKIVPLLISSGGLGIDEDGNFFVLLNDMNSVEENACSLGHEIAHTFHKDLTKDPPIDILSPGLCEITETFCHAFSEKWLIQNGKKDVIQRCRNQMMLITQCDS